MKISNNTIKKSQREEFNSLLREARQEYSSFVEDFASRHELNTLLRFMPNLSSSSILDIGCGRGRFAIPIAKIAKNVVGIDTSDYSIKLFCGQIKKERLQNISARVMDFHDLPNEKKFDYVLMVNAVHHIPEMKVLLEKVRKVLRKNGRLIIYEFNPLNPLYIPFLIYYKQASMHMNREYFRSNIWTMGRIFGRSNYSEVSKFRYGFLPTVLYNVSPIFVKINTALNSIPLLNQLCAFHILSYKIRTRE